MKLVFFLIFSFLLISCKENCVLYSKNKLSISNLIELRPKALVSGHYNLSDTFSFSGIPTKIEDNGLLSFQINQEKKLLAILSDDLKSEKSCFQNKRLKLTGVLCMFTEGKVDFHMKNKHSLLGKTWTIPYFNPNGMDEYLHVCFKVLSIE